MPDELPFIANAIKTITPEKTPEIARKLAIDKAKEVIATVTLSNAESDYLFTTQVIVFMTC